MKKLKCTPCAKELKPLDMPTMFFLVEQVFKNGTKHVRAECCRCGRFFQYIPQREPVECDEGSADFSFDPVDNLI